MTISTPNFPFDEDLKDVHLIYDYDAKDAEGKPEKWRYEMWFFSQTRAVYKIHGGPMAGRTNFQTCTFQCIRPGELWQCNWLEALSALKSTNSLLVNPPFQETGTVVSLVYDIPNKRITTLLAFSKGHWEHAAEAHGDKRNPDDFERWRGLAKIGTQADRHMLSEQADIVEIFRGKGDLEPIEEAWPTL